MNGLLPSPTLIDLSLRRDLHLIIVLQVTASVPESFVEIGVWGGKKKKRPDKCPDGRKGSCVCVLVVFASFLSGLVCQLLHPYHVFWVISTFRQIRVPGLNMAFVLQLHILHRQTSADSGISSALTQNYHKFGSK